MRPALAPLKEGDGAHALTHHEDAMRTDLPSGIVTLLFTDVESSTKLLHELGSHGYAQALGEHRRIVRDAFGRHGGVEVDTQGDAFFVAFGSAQEAVEAANEIVAALEATPIRVRIGIHTGEPHLTDEGYIGPDVNKGARIAASGHGGQVLVSQETHSAVRVEMTDLGEHRVKDFDSPVWIYQLGGERFPPLKTISNTNLPTPASSLVGRQGEVKAVTSLLEDGRRLVTLAGPGGTGKTRLSIEAASVLVPQFRNGVFWVGLAPLKDPALVGEEIARTIGAQDGLAEHIAEREMLLLLDNFEQVIGAAPELSALLDRCRNLKVMVTSRELLRIAGEVAYAVPPLAQSEAVELFCTRSGVEPDEPITELCRRLDNLPLAVELAAARVRVLSPAQILERLARRLDLLKGGRDADPRQATLRATIEWSHDLLDDDEKRLFARLAVFRSGCTLEAAEQVCNAELDVLQGLVDKSLVRHTGERFWMLETIRDYAGERLTQSPEADDIGRRHAEFFLELAEEAEPSLRRYDKAWLDRIGNEHDNIRATLDHLEGSGETQEELRLVGAIYEFWSIRGHNDEARTRLEAALERDQVPTRARAKALNAASDTAMAAKDVATSGLHAEEARRISEELEDPWGVAQSMFLLGDVAANEGRWEDARRLFEQCVERFRTLGDEQHALWAGRMLGWMYSELGERARARSLYEDNLARARSIANEQITAETLEALASLAVADGEPRDAIPLLREAYGIRRGLDDVFRLGVLLIRFAGVLAAEGFGVEAIRCLAGGERLLEESGASPPWVEDMKQQAIERIELDEPSVVSARDEGRKLTADEGLSLALAALSES